MIEKPAEPKDMRSALSGLAEWAAQTQWDDIPAATQRRAVRIIGDHLAAAVAARDEPEVRALHARILESATAGEATLFRGGRSRVNRHWAAIANAVAASWLELDEGYRVTPCHAALYAIPALLAKAESGQSRIEEVLRALVLGYEIVTRIARCFPPPNFAMHIHARYAAIGACAASALLCRASVPTMLQSLGGAASLVNPGPRRFAVEGVLIRNAWAAVGAFNGLLAVELAECGIGGGPESFEEVFVGILGSSMNAAELSCDLGREWAMMDGYTKSHACCQQTHSAVEAAMSLHKQLGARFDAESVRSIVVATHPMAMPLNNRHPRTTLAAKFSLPHVVASTLTFGSAGVPSFSTSTLDDDAIGRIRETVEITAYTPNLPAPLDRPARIVVNLRDGRTLTAECLSAPGSPDQPFSDEDVLGKIESLGAPVYPGLAPTIRSLMVLDRESLEQPWAAAVAAICGD